MLNSLLFLLGFTLIGSQVVLHDFGDKKLYDFDFFYENPKNQWLDFSKDKKQEAFDSFLRKELVYYDSQLLGLNYTPGFLMDLEERKKQLSVNFYYERFVALPLVEDFYFETTTKNLERDLFVHHLLFGYKGCALDGVFNEKETVLASTLLVYEQLRSFFNKNKDNDERLKFFKETALAFSEDPSVINNSGQLGWVSWGKSVDEFQVPLFLLEKGSVSSPILTPYGFHLVFVEKERPSNFSYYNKAVLKDFSNKASLQSLSFDLLKETSLAHDKKLLIEGGFVLNTSYVKPLIDKLSLFLKESSLRGNKKNYLSFFEAQKKESVLFVFQKKGFGLDWLIKNLSKTPSTRVPSLKTEDDFMKMVSGFVLQASVFNISETLGVLDFPVVKKELEKHKKNILYNAYIKHISAALGPVDSLIVKNKYKEGLKDSSFFSLKKALVYELNFSKKMSADSVLVLLEKGSFFDDIYFLYNKKTTTKSISKGTKGLLGEAAFSLKEGEVSEIIENTDKTFSIIKSIGFVDPSPLPLSSVYVQIEKQTNAKLKKELKTNLYEKLLKQFSVSFNIKDLQ